MILEEYDLDNLRHLIAKFPAGYIARPRSEDELALRRLEEAGFARRIERETGVAFVPTEAGRERIKSDGGRNDVE